MRFLNENGNNGILPLNADVTQELKAKHPEAKDPSDEALLYGPIDDVPSLIYHELNGEMNRRAAFRTKGLGVHVVLMQMDSEEFLLVNCSNSLSKIVPRNCHAC